MLKTPPSVVLIVNTPDAESNEVEETPATATVPTLSTNPNSFIVMVGIKVAVP